MPFGTCQRSTRTVPGRVDDGWRSTGRSWRGELGTIVPICPIPGRNLRFLPIRCTLHEVYVDPRLLRHVEQTSGLTTTEAQRLVEDVLAFHDETVEEWVRRRHGELKTHGHKNVDIYTLLREELRDHVVAAPDLSERQLRRMIYG